MDLNGLIDPNLGITLTRANGINDMGQIIAYSESGFVRTAYLLTPVPEPSSLVLLTPFFETVCVKYRELLDTNSKTEKKELG